ncbi:MAG: ATP-binding protein [Bacteroidetes bacterium]|nr:ATP-binding protein [Bacteroidota bacterium]
MEDDNLLTEIQKYKNEEAQRDFLISHYTYQVREHFEELLFDNEFTEYLHDTYIDILSELITNGVLHSKSNTFALMFVDKYKTKFSISDNGIGLEESIRTKMKPSYYTPTN